jgi:threonyl-tRNA synthetase
LSPTQVAILTVTDRQLDYARKLDKLMKASGIRASADERGEKLGYKIREAQLQKVPYMLILGDKEVESGKVSVRLNNGKVIEAVAIEDFIKNILCEIKERQLASVFLTAPNNMNQEANNSSI